MLFLHMFLQLLELLEFLTSPLGIAASLVLSLYYYLWQSPFL